MTRRVLHLIGMGSVLRAPFVAGWRFHLPILRPYLCPGVHGAVKTATIRPPEQLLADFL